MGKREHIYEIIAENIRKERRRLGITVKFPTKREKTLKYAL